VKIPLSCRRRRRRRRDASCFLERRSKQGAIGDACGSWEEHSRSSCPSTILPHMTAAAPE